MNEKKLTAKDHVITLMLKSGIEQLIHTEPIDADGLMIITITPQVTQDNKLECSSNSKSKCSIMRIYSYSNSYEYIFGDSDPVMIDAITEEDNVHHHLIKIDVIKKSKSTNQNRESSEFKRDLLVKSDEPCAIWNTGTKKINDLLLERKNNKGTLINFNGANQICKYRWV